MQSIGDNKESFTIKLTYDWIPKDPCYKGVYYRYNESKDTWILYDNFYCGNVMHFSNKYRLDECFDIFENRLKEE